MTNKKKLLTVFTDMDGTLLDHYTYDFTPAIALLAELKKRGVPVIPATSKSRAEMDFLCEKIQLTDGYAAENGAVACLPPYLFSATSLRPHSVEEMQIQVFAKPAYHWRNLAQAACIGFSCTLFSACSPAEISDMTGLDQASAKRALDRQFGEVVAWQDSDENLDIFQQRLEESGACMMRGGRFLHVTGDIDKGRTMRWIAAQYANKNATETLVIAAGDSENDIPMLAAADIAVVVRSPVHDVPKWGDSSAQPGQKIITTNDSGPAGWQDGMILALEYAGTRL